MGKYIRKLPVRQQRSPGNRPKNGIFPEKRRMIPVIISPIPNNIKILPVCMLFTIEIYRFFALTSISPFPLQTPK